MSERCVIHGWAHAYERCPKCQPMSEGKLQPWIETSLRAGVSEIQRRQRERGHVIQDYRGNKEPVMTTEEMLKVLRQFLESSKEGLG